MKRCERFRIPRLNGRLLAAVQRFDGFHAGSQRRGVERRQQGNKQSQEGQGDAVLNSEDGINPVAEQ